MREYNNSNPNFEGSRDIPMTYSSPEGDVDWRELAACKDTDDPELFFPVGNTGPALVQIEKAKTVCNACSVREKCLSWAMVHNQDSGVWGGLSEAERRSIKRRSSRARRTDMGGAVVWRVQGLTD